MFTFNDLKIDVQAQIAVGTEAVRGLLVDGVITEEQCAACTGCLFEKVDDEFPGVVEVHFFGPDWDAAARVRVTPRVLQ
jgi:hypothetical protein